MTSRVFTKAIEVYSGGNVAPGNPVTIDVSQWVPANAISFSVSCPLGSAPACTSSNINIPGTVDFSWIGYAADDLVNAQDKFLQIALHNQVPGSLQEMSGKSVEFPVVNGVRSFAYKTACPNQHDFYDCARVWFWLTSWDIP